MRKVNILVLLVVFGLCAPSLSLAEDSSFRLERARGERLSQATGHYSRARSLLLAAIREFDKGLKLANPDVLIDSEEWRGTVLDRAEELERVLDPQPRVSASGARFEADSRLLLEAR